MPQDPIDTKCSTHFTWRQLIECGETWRRVGNRVPNLPSQAESWVSLQALAQTVLDPVVEHFGAVELTYCFAGPELLREVPGRIAPALDQHAGSELNRRGKLICTRRGQAADLYVPGVSSDVAAAWVATHTPFDRLYLYGPDRPLHVSFGPDNTRQVVEMIAGPSGRRVPRVRRA